MLKSCLACALSSIFALGVLPNVVMRSLYFLYSLISVTSAGSVIFLVACMCGGWGAGIMATCPGPLNTRCRISGCNNHRRDSVVQSFGHFQHGIRRDF
jgi:hypothetical protein